MKDEEKRRRILQGFSKTSWDEKILSSLRIEEREKLKNIPTMAAIKWALNWLIRNAQKKHYGENYKKVKQQKYSSVSPKLLKLNPFIANNGVMKMYSRLNYAKDAFPEQVRNPTILPTSEYLSSLIIFNEHKALTHAGPEVIFRSLKTKY